MKALLLEFHPNKHVVSVADTGQHVCNAALYLLFTIALFMWGLFVNKQWTAAQQYSALALFSIFCTSQMKTCVVIGAVMGGGGGWVFVGLFELEQVEKRKREVREEDAELIDREVLNVCRSRYPFESPSSILDLTEMENIKTHCQQ
jgi:hypothetical protein